MNSKLLITVLSSFATIGGLFLFSSNSPQPKLLSADMVEAMTTPHPSKIPLPKTKLTSSAVLVPTLPSPSGSESAVTPSPLTTQTPASTPTPTSPPWNPPVTTPVSTPTVAPPLTPTPTPEQSTKININTADKQKLEEITGVGPVIAQRIIDYRNTHGPFQKIEDIKNVSGIGDKNFEKMKDEITVGG